MFSLLRDDVRHLEPFAIQRVLSDTQVSSRSMEMVHAKVSAIKGFLKGDARNTRN
jgi:hypothetical protein